jgi:FdhE protein
VRQFDTPSSAAWVGNPQGGVSQPDPILLPDPATRFKRTAARLADLANDHPMSDWLLFLCNLSQAQHEAVQAIHPPLPDADAITKAGAGGMPPLAADGHRRDPAWRDALRLLLERFDGAEDSPEALAAVVTDLKSRSDTELEALADSFLKGSVPAGASLFIAAALQVYFTRLAAGLPVEQVHLLPERNLCPCCGSSSVAGLVTASGKTPGVRYLFCSLCSTAWNHVRVVCITCGESGKIAVRGIDGGDEAIQAETCDDCHTYSKSFYLAKDGEIDAYADDLASLGLDIMVSEAGWARHAPNPFLLSE